MDRGPTCPTERVKSSIFTVRLDRSAIHSKLKSNDLSMSKDSYFYLSATEGKMFANENSNGSFLAHHHANKKNLQKTLLKDVFGRITYVN